MVNNTSTNSDHCWSLHNIVGNLVDNKQDNHHESVSKNVLHTNLVSPSLNNFNVFNKRKVNNLTIYHQNICGIKNKITEFILTIAGTKPHIICFSEHHLKGFDLNSSFLPYIPSYKLGTIYSRTNLKGGGVSIFIHEEIKYLKIDLKQYCKEQDIEIVAVKIKYNTTNYSIYCLYRSPTGNLEYFYEQLDKVLDSNLHTKSKIIICGDLNIDFLDFITKSTQLKNFLHSFNLAGTVHFPTRITSSTSSTIDNILLREHINCNISPHINGLSDHDGQLLTLTDSACSNETKDYECWMLNQKG